MLVKVPPVIVRPEELVKNDMSFTACNLKGNLILAYMLLFGFRGSVGQC
jgi:hypothetical protein